jgi:hypothetical protein
MLHRRHLLLGAVALPLAGAGRADTFPNGPFRSCLPTKGQPSILAAADEAIE